MKQYMVDAYEREMNLLPIVIDIEMRGVRLDPEIEDIQAHWQDTFDKGDERLKEIGGPGAEPGKKSMFNALITKGLIDKSKLQYTAKGNARFGREFLELYVDNEELKTILRTRSKLQKALGTYINPWAESARLYNGRFYPYFSQTRNDTGSGTRTGRFSSDLQQIPRVTDEGLPNLRSLIQPEVGHALIKRDFNGQELRVAAHYAEGNILQAYIDDPKLDVHQFVQDMIKDRAGIEVGRVEAKTMNFLKLYGGGALLLASKLNITEGKARAFYAAYDAAIPEFKQLMIDVEKQVRKGIKLRTWGGRTYDVEPSSNHREYYYKLGNVLIQGSSADMTKEAMIRYQNHPERQGEMILTVHDEIVVSCPKEAIKSEMAILKWAMDDIPGWDVPLRSEGKVGINFGEMHDYED